MRVRAVAAAVVAAGVALSAPATAGAALSFARTDYPLPNLSGPTRTSDVGPGYYDDGPIGIVDLNKDGKPDIAIADFGTGRVNVLLNQGGGAFATAPGSPFDACESDLEAHDLAAGQLNPQSDQNPDVAVVCDTGNGTGVGPGIVRLLGDGSGSLAAPETFFTGAGAGGVGTPLKLAHLSGSAGGDFLYGNGPGHACFIAVTSAPGAGSATCDGSVFASGLSPVHFYDDPCFAGDEMLSFSGPGTFIGSGLVPRADATSCSASFSTSNDRSSGIAGPNNATAMGAADLNGDGEPDVVMADSGGNFHVVAWQGASTDFAGGIPPGAQPSNFASLGPIYSERIADFDGNGCGDIAGSEVVSSDRDAAVIHLGHCNTTQFDSGQAFDVAGDNNTNTDLTKMTVGDLNGDGKPDIVTTAGYAGAATVLLNTTPPQAGSGGGGGGGGGGGPGGGQAVLAALSRPRISPSVFAAAPSGPSVVAARKRTFGAKVTYTLNQVASVRFTVAQPQAGRKGKRGACVKPTRRNRNARKCTRLVTLRGSFTLAGRSGANSFRFTGRLARRALKPGKYKLVATPSAGGQTGRSVNAAFRIVK